MQARLNMQMLNTSTFDSGALGPLAMVVHTFNHPGKHSALVLRHGRPVGELAFVVDEKSDAMQLDFDLSKAGPQGANASGGCQCHCDGQAAPLPSVSPKGYVLFHASTGSGYAVTVAGGDGKPAFDSTRLEAGDLFAVSLLEPTGYHLENTVSGAKGSIAVAFDDAIAQRIRSLETQYVEANGKKFSTSKIALASTQGLVFRIMDAARIVITREGGPRPSRDKPVLRWQKPVSESDRKPSGTAR